MPKSSTNIRHFINAGILVVIGTFLMNWLLQAGLPMPPQASSQAVIIDRLFRQHVLLIAFLFALVCVFMVYAIVVFRRKEGDEEEGEHFEGNTVLEIGWTAGPMIFVLIFGYLGVTTLQEVTAPQPDELVVKVNGFQWDWTFEYENGVVSQELVLPIDQPAVMEMTATDVLHSFWVPAFRVKQDLVPGQTTELRFTPTLLGDDYRLRCAELCGLSHYDMRAKVRVVEQAEFAMWLEEEYAKLNPALANKSE